MSQQALSTPHNLGSTIVMKFGGASLATASHFDSIAKLIALKSEQFPNVVVVVSAMGKTTDELIGLAKQVNPIPPQRELDMLISVGERISMALLAMACQKHNKEAISFTGSQSGIITCSQHTEARIIDVKPNRIMKSLAQNKIVIVAGFQGVSRAGEITTLGRGGSDTTAVALGVSLKATKVEFYKDVPGIFSEDPKSNPNASLFSKMSYNEALAIVTKGARVLHNRCIELAQTNQIPLHILSFKEEYQQFGGTIIEPTHTRPDVPIYELESSPSTLCCYS